MLVVLQTAGSGVNSQCNSIQVEFVPGDPLSDPTCETFAAMSGIFDECAPPRAPVFVATRRLPKLWMEMCKTIGRSRSSGYTIW